jgi:hypothetical protein
MSERVKYWVRPDIINRIEEGASPPPISNAEITEIAKETTVSFSWMVLLKQFK